MALPSLFLPVTPRTTASNASPSRLAGPMIDVRTSEARLILSSGLSACSSPAIGVTSRKERWSRRESTRVASIDVGNGRNNGGRKAGGSAGKGDPLAGCRWASKGGSSGVNNEGIGDGSKVGRAVRRPRAARRWNIKRTSVRSATTALDVVRS